MFNTIDIEFNDHVTKKVTIDMTQDADVVMEAMCDLFKDAIGDKFGAAQVAALKDDKLKDIADLLKCNFQSGSISFHRVNFDDGMQIMSKIRIDKNK